MRLFVALGINGIQHSDTQHTEIRYAECHDYLVFTLGVIMLSVVIRNVVMLSVLAPFPPYHGKCCKIVYGVIY